MGIRWGFFLGSFILFTTITTVGLCDVSCLTTIGKNQTFLNQIKNITGNNQLDQGIVDDNQTGFYSLIAENIYNHCFKTNLHDFNKIAETDYVVIPFVFDGKQYDITVNTNELFVRMQIPIAFWVINDINKKPGDKITQADTPPDYWYTSACSDHYVDVNLSNKVPVNKAGKAAFAAYGGEKEEFFLDFPVKKGCIAFPGLIIKDRHFFGDYSLVTYQNYKEALKTMKTFASNLNNTACSPLGLAVYLVQVSNVSSIPHACEVKNITVLSEPEIIR